MGDLIMYRHWIKLSVDYVVRTLVVIGASFLLLSSCARAVTVNFDELDRSTREEYPEGYLTNEYESIGLVFFAGSAFLGMSSDGGNYVAGPGFGFYFEGELPTNVSMYVWSGTGHALFPRVYFSSGEFEDTITKGAITGMFGDDSREPYYLPQLITFSSPLGISAIHLGSQSSTNMDDLTFTYGPLAAVSEPSAFILFGLGFIGLVLRKRRKNNY